MTTTRNSFAPSDAATFEPLECSTDGKRSVGWPDMSDGRWVLPDLVEKAAQPINAGGLSVIEVGTWAGATAILMADSSPCMNVFCVDPWTGSPNDATGVFADTIGPENVFRTFCRNVGDRLFRSIIPCRGTSQQWAAVWPSKVAMVFIDAAHDKDDVLADIALWSPHVLPGGILCGHDYQSFKGVKQAVDETFGGEANIEGNVWWVQIPE